MDNVVAMSDLGNFTWHHNLSVAILPEVIEFAWVDRIDSRLFLHFRSEQYDDVDIVSAG